MSASFATLMFHATPSSAIHADYFAVPEPALVAQLTWMREREMRGLSLESLLDDQASSPDSVARVAMTFDDAHLSNYEVALPRFVEAGMTATVFVVPAWVGQPGYCSWPQLREMHAAGWSIQSHTLTHPFLSTLDAAAVRRELTDSRQAIEDELGAPVVTLALPNGDWPRRPFRHAVHEAGYRFVATSRWHANGDAERRSGVFGRYTVRRETTMDAFGAMLTALPGRWSPEAVRLTTLNVVRSTLGVERYRAIRRLLVERRRTAAARVVSGD